MNSGLEVIVNGIFDYAGMYPPAALPFEQALKTAARLPAELNRPHLVVTDQVIEPKHLSLVNSGSLSGFGFAQDRQVTFGLLGGAFNSKQDVISQERLNELADLVKFNTRGAQENPRQRISSYEFKLGADVQTDAQVVKIAVRNIKSFLLEENVLICVEPDLSKDAWLEGLEEVCKVLVDLNQNGEGPLVALKMRGNGPTAIGNDRLKSVVSRVAAYNLPFKATGSLHHPIIEAERYKNGLGFINLSVALLLARTLGSSDFPETLIWECLNESESAAFDFSSGFSWRGVGLAQELLSEVKGNLPFTIGSCSLHEPDADLVRLFGEFSESTP